jgi:hypothetical protein
MDLSGYQMFTVVCTKQNHPDKEWSQAKPFYTQKGHTFYNKVRVV